MTAATHQTPDQLQRFERELRDAPEPVEQIVTTFLPVEVEPERVIKCSPENIERAVCRAVARCREWGELWKVEEIYR